MPLLNKEVYMELYFSFLGLFAIFSIIIVPVLMLGAIVNEDNLL